MEVSITTEQTDAIGEGLENRTIVEGTKSVYMSKIVVLQKIMNENVDKFTDEPFKRDSNGSSVNLSTFSFIIFCRTTIIDTHTHYNTYNNTIKNSLYSHSTK